MWSKFLRSNVLKLFNRLNYKRNSQQVQKLLYACGTGVLTTVGTDMKQDSHQTVHIYTIKEACTNLANSATSLLITTMSNIEVVSDKYRTSLMKLTSLLEECILLNGWHDELWDAVITTRHEVNTYKTELNNLLLFKKCVDQIVESSIEASFNANANYVCKSLCESSFSAQEELTKTQKEIESLEQQYLKLQTLITQFKRSREEDEEQETP